ncbi:ABC transporter permease [Armatimonas sp.]|uniref:ABC transporter permease n=1 Tax=Armatimonas sp. TaxID=1872638 RepID=UPI003750133A
MLTIARLTLKEALRRRAGWLSLLVAVLVVLGGFVPLTGRLLLLPREQADRIFIGLYIFLGTDILKFFGAVFGIALASGAISSEIDRGVLSTILPKPLTRTAVYAGKWLGILGFVLGSLLLWALVLFAVATLRDPAHSHRNLFAALPCLALYPVVFTSLALCFSTFTAFPLAAGLSVMAAGIGWAEGLLRFLERTFAIQALGIFASTASYAMPIGRMARWTTKLLGPFPSLDGKTITLSSPFPGQQPMPTDFAFIAGYVVLVFLVGALVFGRRDL